MAKIVDKVGTRTYWEKWASDVADIARAQETRIKALIDGASPEITQAFNDFVVALQGNLNDSITDEDAINMLSQHLITKPVFDALFEGYDFAAQNPVSQVMQAMVETLQDQSLEAETQRLEGFYSSVRTRASDIDNAEGKQKIIVELYEKFFRLGFKKTTQALGIVYTPVPIVDFILRAANDVLKQEFGTTLSHENVHILDPFVGTGTFIVRLLQSGLIKPDDLLRKYTSELHANEIMLLAYYIAAINIEATFHGIQGGDYQAFEGIVLTDTFQIGEASDTMDSFVFPQNNARIVRQQTSPIKVVVGNPPYSVGQTTANDNNANMFYPTLDAAIEKSYAKRSTATSQRTLYDSYIRALRWATDRIGESGIVAYVTNGGWIDGNTADGIRLSLADEFSALYVYNLRGNARTSGELRKRERGNVFGVGARTTVAIIIAAKNPAAAEPCVIRYRDIGDYLSAEEKLDIVEAGTLSGVDWETITPHASGDWINHRTDNFVTYPAIGDKKATTAGLLFFDTYSLGLATGRDSWACNFSRSAVAENAERMIDFYNAQVAAYQSIAESERVDVDDFIDADPTKISWNRNAKADLERGTFYDYRAEAVVTGMYRPYTKENIYFDKQLNAMTYQLPRLFPKKDLKNFGFHLNVGNTNAPFCALMTDCLPDLNFFGAGGQYFPRFSYVKNSKAEQIAFEGSEDESGYRRVDNITDGILADYRSAFGVSITKDDIFFYVYGLLHSSQYRDSFASDLKKMLPRIPKAMTTNDFDAFANAGRALSDLHLGYEAAEPYQLDETITGTLSSDERELYRVDKMSFISKTDKSGLVYNRYVTLEGIPDKVHDYMLGSRSALEWLVDRYRVTTDKASGIVNDPNDWCDEHDDPRYIVDLIKRIVTVSIETMKIVDGLPALDLA